MTGSDRLNRRQQLKGFLASPVAARTAFRTMFVDSLRLTSHYAEQSAEILHKPTPDLRRDSQAIEQRSKLFRRRSALARSSLKWGQLKWGQESIARWPGGCCALLTPDPISKAENTAAPCDSLHAQSQSHLPQTPPTAPTVPCPATFLQRNQTKSSNPNTQPSAHLPTQPILASIKLCPRCCHCRIGTRKW